MCAQAIVHDAAMNNIKNNNGLRPPATWASLVHHIQTYTHINSKFDAFLCFDLYILCESGNVDRKKMVKLYLVNAKRRMKNKFVRKA